MMQFKLSTYLIMDLVIIYGPPAVGKMTVGQELMKITNLKLFHNHMSLELVNQFFPFGTPEFSKLDKHIRFGIFEAIADSNLPGLIFTIVLAFNEPEDKVYLAELIQMFEKRAPKVHLVELEASLEERLIRNKNPHRLQHKPSKRDTAFSEKVMLHHEETYRMNSKEGEMEAYSVFRINNTNIPPAEVAKQIKAYFKLGNPDE